MNSRKSGKAEKDLSNESAVGYAQLSWEQTENRGESREQNGRGEAT